MKKTEIFLFSATTNVRIRHPTVLTTYQQINREVCASDAFPTLFMLRWSVGHSCTRTVMYGYGRSYMHSKIEIWEKPT